MYMDYKIPFWMNTRAETINQQRADGLEEMNMLRCDIGMNMEMLIIEKTI